MNKVDISPQCVFFPQPMYVIGTNNEDGTPNFSVITWLGFSFHGSPHLMMTIFGTKRTKANILREGRFSANIVTQDILWLADYLGCTKGNDQVKDALPYHWRRGSHVDVPLLEESHWQYECVVSSVQELDQAHLFLAKIENIQIDEAYRDMDMERIDLHQVQPVLYAPYRYYAVGDQLGDVGDWSKQQE